LIATLAVKIDMAAVAVLVARIGTAAVVVMTAVLPASLTLTVTVTAAIPVPQLRMRLLVRPRVAGAMAEVTRMIAADTAGDKKRRMDQMLTILVPGLFSWGEL
jgi:hypothetical protein